MEKTIKEWLESLYEPYRTQALENMDNDGVPNSLESSLRDAIEGAFWWESSPQGHYYWKNLRDLL